MNFDGVIERLERQSKDPEWQKAQAEREAQEQRDLVRRRHKTLGETGIPVRFTEIIRVGASATEATSALGDIGDGVVVLSGDPGCGKTVAACAWLSEAIMTGPLVDHLSGYRGGMPLFVTSARLSRWDRYDRDEMNRLLRADRLVIDDLGSEYADVKGNFNAILDELVSDRHGNRRPLVITTNLNGEAFKARYDDRIADRIREVGRFVSIKGSSMRKRAAT